MKPPKRLFKNRPRARGRRIEPVDSDPSVEAVDSDPDLLTANDPLYIATHEAGHAVAAVVLGLPLRAVDIRKRNLPDGRISVGFTDGEVCTNGQDEDEAMPHLIACYAGCCAEGVVNPRVLEGGSYTNDWKDARTIAVSAVCPVTDRGDGYVEISMEVQKQNAERINELLGAAAKASMELVELHLPAIKRVAKLLLERKQLTGDEVAKVVRENPPIGDD
jgi:ATP-dependent Zn protease